MAAAAVPEHRRACQRGVSARPLTRRSSVTLYTTRHWLQGRMTALLEENHQLKRRNKDLEHKLNERAAGGR